MGKRFIPLNEFRARWNREAGLAKEVHRRMVESQLVENSLAKLDFHFVSNQKDKLIQLGLFLENNYPYEIEDTTRHGWRRWCLNGKTDELPIAADNLFHWVLDMFDRGFQHDAELEGYGALLDPNAVRFPDLNPSTAGHHFDTGQTAYKSGNRSGALIEWNLVALINPGNAIAICSRAIVKAELGNRPGAMSDYDEALRIEPKYWNALSNRGCLKHDLGDYAGAITDHSGVIDGTTNESEKQSVGFANRGNSKFYLGDISGACRDWRTAQELGADFVSERVKKHCQECGDSDD